MNKLLFLLLFICSAQISVARETVVGTDNPSFVQAVEGWLEGNDTEALQSLSRLASAGHVPSKILLSRIADIPKFSAHISETLSRKERIALFREPKGLSGRDWLASASEESDLANALWVIQSLDPLEAPDFEALILTLISYGEIKPVFGYLLESWKRGRGEYAAQVLIENHQLFGAAGRDFLGFVIVSMAQAGKSPPLPTTIDSAEKAREFVRWLRSDVHKLSFSGMLPMGANRIAVPSQREGVEKLSAAVKQLPELQPLALFCEATCALNQQDTCLADGVWAIRQRGTFPYPFSSPAQSLIEDATYWASARFVGDVGRMVRRGGWQACR
jgi:hypothetical protein